MKTLKVGEKQVPFDNSRAVTGFADIFTEDRLVDGVIYLGFGSLRTQVGSEDAEIHGIANLRMTPRMAEEAIRILQKLVRVAKTPIPPSVPLSQAN